MDYTTNAIGIKHGKENPLTLIRDEYLFITGEDACGSAVLAALEHWSNWKVGRKEEGTPWITRSHAKLSTDMLGLYGVRKIADAIKNLEKLGYLEVKGAVGETPRYRLNVENINADLEGYIPYGERTRAKVQTSPAEGKRYPGKKEEGVRSFADIIDREIDSLIDLPIDLEDREDKGNKLGDVKISLEDYLSTPSLIKRNPLDFLEKARLLTEEWDPKSDLDLESLVNIYFPRLEEGTLDGDELGCMVISFRNFMEAISGVAA